MYCNKIVLVKNKNKTVSTLKVLSVLYQAPT
jgi:hypothetical protein